MPQHFNLQSLLDLGKGSISSWICRTNYCYSQKLQSSCRSLDSIRFNMLPLPQIKRPDQIPPSSSCWRKAATAVLRGFTLTFRNQSLLPVQHIRRMCASSPGRQLSRAVPFPKARCSCTAPWFPDNINATQLSLNQSRHFLNISVAAWPLFLAPTEFFKNLQWLLRATQYWPTISSTSTTAEPFASLMVGKSMGNGWAYLYFNQWCVMFWVLWQVYCCSEILRMWGKCEIS